jgi:hypothetical protein
MSERLDAGCGVCTMRVRAVQGTTMRPVEAEEERVCRELQRRADRISSMIVAGDYPGIDVTIQVAKLRGYVEAHLPGREPLFEMIYGSRFRRLWEQFRGPEEGVLPDW